MWSISQWKAYVNGQKKAPQLDEWKGNLSSAEMAGVIVSAGSCSLHILHSDQKPSGKQRVMGKLILSKWQLCHHQNISVISVFNAVFWHHWSLWNLTAHLVSACLAIFRVLAWYTWQVSFKFFLPLCHHCVFFILIMLLVYVCLLLFPIIAAEVPNWENWPAWSLHLLVFSCDTVRRAVH